MAKNKYIEELIREEDFYKNLEIEDSEKLYHVIERTIEIISNDTFGSYKLAKEGLIPLHEELGWSELIDSSDFYFRILTDKGRKIKESYIKSMEEKNEEPLKRQSHSTGYSLMYWGI